MAAEHDDSIEELHSEEEDRQAAVPIYRIASYPA